MSRCTATLKHSIKMKRAYQHLLSLVLLALTLLALGKPSLGYALIAMPHKVDWRNTIWPSPNCSLVVLACFI